jgi:hypothetical protein
MDFIKRTIFYCNNIGPKGCKLAYHVDKYPFYAYMQTGPLSDRLKKLFSFSAFTPSVKPLGLIDFNDCTDRNV